MVFGFGRDKSRMVAADDALAGRSTPMPVPETHYVNGNRLVPPFPEGMATAVFGMGCFWGAERLFWQTPGRVLDRGRLRRRLHRRTRPTRRRAPGRTGHTEVVLVVFDPSADQLRAAAQGVLGGPRPDAGDAPGQRHRHPVPLGGLHRRRDAGRAGRGEREAYGDALREAGRGEITTEIAPLTQFYYAEDYHQQYLAKEPNGYCGIGGTGVACPVGTGVEADRA